jgi:CDP-paratose 2-epimerase
LGDHVWWVSSVAKFRRHYPEWNYQYDLHRILDEIHDPVRTTH